jgi:hypothetical protein
VIPANLLDRLTTAVARWDGATNDDDQHAAGKELAAAAFSVLLWDQSQVSYS